MLGHVPMLCHSLRPLNLDVRELTLCRGRRPLLMRQSNDQLEQIELLRVLATGQIAVSLKQGF